MDNEVYDTALRGGVVVDAASARPADVYVKDGRIAAILEQNQPPLRAAREFDMTGLHVLPGVLDAHTHFRTFSKHSDNFFEMARSAAYGGVTTVLGHIMGMNATELRPRDRVATFVEEAQQGSPLDYGFHVAIANEPHTLDDIPEIAEMGVNSFKMFMAYRARGMQIDDGMMLASMQAIEGIGGQVMIHAEAGDLADQLEQAFVGRNTVRALAESRPPWVEAEATRRALVIAERAEATPYFVHVSCTESLVEIADARARGQRVLMETCPQYLNLTVHDFERIGPLAKIAPPLRDVGDIDALVESVLNGTVDVVASDHSPYRVVDKDLDDVWAVPYGAPGTETLIPATWSAIRARGGSISDLVRVLCTDPASIFGLAGRKGSIAVGLDADFTIVDLDGETVVDGSAQHNTSGYSPYDGLRSPLSVHSTFLRGRPLLADGALLSEDSGEFLRRGVAANKEVPA